MGFFSSLGFLAPLYVAAGMAVGLPILFHLIRRTPKGRQDFSSVMFLRPSPPRITRRSRIENWLLLLLRALAVLLIVAAFCRPLWREWQTRPDDSRGREIVLLVDTSASMQRAGVWEEARQMVLDRLGNLTPADRFTLLAFDDRVQPVLDRGEWLELEPSQRIAVARQRMDELQPGWGATYLDLGLREAADRLEQTDTDDDQSRIRTVWVITDLQEGSRWEGLQGREWPRGVDVELLPIGRAASPTNAGVQLVGQPQAGPEPFVRVRVTNAAGSQREQFQLGWRSDFDDPQTTGPTTGLVDVYVPPGQSRVVRLPQAGDDLTAVRVALGGDDHPFDNLCSVSWPDRRVDRVVYLGSDTGTDREGMRIFLRPLFAATSEREVAILDQFPADAAPAGIAPRAGEPQTDVSLVIATGALDAATLPALQKWLRAGGVTLYVCRDAASSAALFDLAGLPPQPVTEAAITDYAMLRDVDFRHPLFRMLDDPRYSDLSKVHFWHHRVISDDALPGGRVLARFDDGSAAMVEARVGTGRLLVLTSGWNRGDSELATWSKFIPIMNALLETAAPQFGGVSQVTVGEALPVAALRQLAPPPQSVTQPDGTTVPWSKVLADPVVRQPGLYRVYGTAGGAGANRGNAEAARPEPLATIAVNLPPDETRTSELSVDVLDAVGVALDVKGEREAAAGREEQLASTELESRQKLWRWLLGAALAVLLLETILSSRRGRLAEAPAAA